VIEKHFTLDRTLPGPDHAASLEPEELKAMVASIRNIEKAMGNGMKKPSPSESKNIPITRKSIVAVKLIKIGEIFTEGPLDGLVNNAAGNFISRTQDLSHRGFEAIASIVFHGTFYVTHSVGKRWIELEKGGSILSILATWVWTGSAFTVPSAMSKSGINAMTKSLATEWGHAGIRLNAIAPGPFPTEGAWARLSPNQDPNDTSGQGAYSENPMGRVGKMEELGNLATFLMSDGCDYLTGQTIAIDGGEYLTGGTFYRALASMKDEDWDAIKATIKATNEKDKAKRTV
ncbi:MAG TPA: SDR family oxidoreductase, partial [Gammaproteobacteria bacterium]|nr:SDR family oxidoreductase [Gammaproteobacteria bacterium]